MNHIKLLAIIMTGMILHAATLSAQEERDSVTIGGLVTDYDGNAIANCSVMFQNSKFDVLFHTETDNGGRYASPSPRDHTAAWALSTWRPTRIR